MWIVYTADGFDEVARFPASLAGKNDYSAWLFDHPGQYVVDAGNGRMVPVGKVQRRVDRQADYERLFAASVPSPRSPKYQRRARTTELVGPRRADGSYYADKPAGRSPASGSRNGTGHTHPPGRTRCPKCGV